MKYGIVMFPTDYSIGAADLAKAVEQRGFESLFYPEHTHIPASRRTPWPGGADLPKEYWHTLDPFVALTAAAMVTEKLLLGTGIALIMERDPITTAKEVASVDMISNGRFLLGVGGGWNEEEMENHGTDPKRRFKVLRERIEAMKAIWTQDEAEYHGEFVDFDPVWSWPKPVQKPHPPVLIGGDSDHTLKRVIQYGWLDADTDARRRANERADEAARVDGGGGGPAADPGDGVWRGPAARGYGPLPGDRR